MQGFKTIDLYHKSNILEQQARYLITVENAGFSVRLYAWDRFFIEQYIDSSQQVCKIKIADGRDMMKHLETISLGELGYPGVK